ncbi:MAG: hypothetical protein Q9170_002399 [Blastenia crenularia]
MLISFRGTKITETKPLRLHYHTESLVSRESVESIKVTIVKCVDDENEGPPIFVGDGEVEMVANLEVPLSRISLKNLQKRTDKDGTEWNVFDFAIRVTCLGSETIYELMQGKVNYGRVAAEFFGLVWTGEFGGLLTQDPDWKILVQSTLQQSPYFQQYFTLLFLPSGSKPQHHHHIIRLWRPGKAQNVGHVRIRT